MPPFYEACVPLQLSTSHWVMLQMLVIMAQPITVESYRCSIQRFLLQLKLKVKSIWFPILKQWLKYHVKGDRQAWGDLHQQLSWKFHPLHEAVQEAMEQTPRSSSLVENLNL